MDAQPSLTKAGVRLRFIAGTLCAFALLLPSGRGRLALCGTLVLLLLSIPAFWHGVHEAGAIGIEERTGPVYRLAGPIRVESDNEGGGRRRTWTARRS